MRDQRQDARDAAARRARPAASVAPPTLGTVISSLRGTVLASADGRLDLEVHGEERTVYLSALPIKTMTGEIAEVMVMLQDLSNLESLRRARLRETAAP